MKRDREAVNQRHAEMLSLIRQRQEVLVTELCQIFDISPMTARRDLQVLEERGKLRRFHGGAAIDRHAEIPLDPMDVSRCKRWIARYAASQVKDGDCPPWMMSQSATQSDALRTPRLRKSPCVLWSRGQRKGHRAPLTETPRPSSASSPRRKAMHARPSRSFRAVRRSKRRFHE